MSNSFTTDQWIRRVSLIVAGESGNGIDLSNMRIVFQTRAWEQQTWPTLQARVYNLSTSTVQKLLKHGEYTKVQLKAGYKNGWYGTIFTGTVKQFRTGRETPTDTYFDIYAADGDLLNHTHAASTLPPNTSWQDVLKAVDQEAQKNGITAGYGGSLLSDSPVFLNGKALYGPVTPLYDDIAYNNNMVWHVWGGQRHLVPSTGVLPGNAIVLNSRTGLIGMPEATQDGVHVTCLLNPSIRPMTLIQINNKDINQVHNVNVGDYSGVGSNYAILTGQSQLQFFASVAADGFYVVLYVEHVGDTRGTPWYSELVCVARDSSQNRTAMDLGAGWNDTNAYPFGSPGGGGPNPDTSDESSITIPESNNGPG